METKLSRLKMYMSKGNHRSALKLAASFPRLGSHADTIRRAWAAMSNPAFYSEIGEDPEKLIASGLEAIRERYGIG